METNETIKCESCSGSGIYRGAVRGTCYACEGKGFQNEADQLRNAAYWRYRVNAECRSMFREADEKAAAERANELYVVFSGPEPDTNRDGDEIPVWYVGIMRGDDDEVKGYSVRSFERAQGLAAKIAA